MLLSDSARKEVFPGERLVSSSTSYDAVIVGLAPALFDYKHMNEAFRILAGEPNRNTGEPVPLIATHKAKYIEKDDPPGLSLGPGPFVTALENATGREAHIIGKPTKTFFQLVIDDFSSAEINPEDDDGKIAVVGDDVEADLGGAAVELGLWRVLGEGSFYPAIV